MLTREKFRKIATDFYDWCEYPAVKYKVLFHFLETPYENPELTELRKDYLSSDIVNQLYETQLPDGSWGPLRSKDYSCKSTFPTTEVAVSRCLYIGLTLEDKDILFMALEYLEEILQGKSKIVLHNKNERDIPGQMSEIATFIERIKPYNPLCDRLWSEWNYIASAAFSDGEYSHERDKKAQQEIYFTKEDRLIPIQTNLLLSRPDKLSISLQKDMLNYYGRNAYYHGHFWDKSLDRLPDHFVSDKTRRWFHTIRYINQFYNTGEYLQNTMEWLMDHKTPDGFWDYGTQTKDPWGYFGYFSTNRNYRYNRIIDCTMEVLDMFKTFLEHNGSELYGGAAE